MLFHTSKQPARSPIYRNTQLVAAFQLATDYLAAYPGNAPWNPAFQADALLAVLKMAVTQ